MSNSKKNIVSVILAAGKGTRFGLEGKNKVTMELAGKPLVTWIVDHLEEAGLTDIIAVVGFAKESVKTVLGERVRYANQEKRLGTGDAVKVAFTEISETVEQVMVVSGDHGSFYTPEFFNHFLEEHQNQKNAMTLATIKRDNPNQLAWGRVIRDESGVVVGVVEQKHVNKEQEKIKELNAALYVFDREILEEALKTLQKRKTGEYYLPDVIDYCLKNGLRVGAVEAPESMAGFGINTREQLEIAEEKFKEIYK
jgi:bifunctional UDP-N-acetylglucosamine pyrophosphorylase / glucosamine-1-phosphate N-acetyltransferase